MLGTERRGGALRRLPGRAARAVCALAVSCLALVAPATAHADNGTPPVQQITVDGAGTGRVFDGIGAISGGGGTSRLLVDYPEPERSRILDYLFKPGYGASLQLLKAEIGGDANSTDGSEPSIEHVRGTVNCNAGYEFWLMEQAKARNPGIKLYGLAWAAPQALSSGHGAMHLYMAQQALVVTLLAVFALKLCASVISLAFGFRGGLFFASLFLGAVLGQIFARLWAFVPDGIPLSPMDASLVGMAALAAAVVGGPMTMSFLVLEATHDFEITAVVLTATLCSSTLVRERFGYSFSTWRLHLRGEVVRSARDIGWMRTLTARRMMRTAPATASPAMPVKAFREQFPLGSTSRVLLQDEHGRYAGLVPTAAAFADPGPIEKPVSDFAILKDVTLSPDMSIVPIMELFDSSAADDLAVVDAQGRIVGMLTERYVRKRYADELDRAQRELYGED